MKITRLPTKNSFSKNAIAAENPMEYITAVRTKITEERDKLHKKEQELKELEEYAVTIESIVAAILASSVDSELITTAAAAASSGIIIESETDILTGASEKVM